jgi:epoxyqueuosine reductase
MASVPSSSSVKARARSLGFDLVGIAPVRPSDHGAFYRAWIEAGYHGDMGYLARADAVERRLDPRGAFPALRSAVVVGHNYYVPDREPGALEDVGAADQDHGTAATPGIDPTDLASDRVVAAHPPSRGASGVPPSRVGPAPAPSGDPGRATIARYARGRDYHKVVKKKLLRLLGWIEKEVGRELPAARAYVDTGPVLERPGEDLLDFALLYTSAA